MKWIIFIVLLFFVAVIGVLHTVTPGHLILYHDTYRRLSYFPIAIGAVYFGLGGGILFAVLSCMSFIPHLYMFWARVPEAYYSELSEILFYLAAGIVIGLISSRKNHLQEKYKTLSEKLAASYQRLSSQTSQLVEAEKQLGESLKLSMLGQVAASLAHEIKNPLASIKGAAEILADEVLPGHPKYEFIEIMRAEISRLNHSVEDVLKLFSGKPQQDTFARQEGEKIVQRVLALLETRLQQKHIQVSVLAHPDVSGFMMNEDAMIQVLMNIIINAVDAVEKNGIIQIHIKPDKKGCLVRIEDNGPGIPKADMQTVFNSFVTFKEGGTGLGLSISRKIIERLGGQIEVENSALGGAAFLIYLPEEPFLNAGDA
ncbi:MAG: ATP-binding protein [Proteobacteria bacterium]|nr:ATP-binding protein [Pseudomonadota bacterium]MBU1390038.1 ATP-binding protein [Pseudomonadota bacterium]MBU1545011.1 ATP-binding protein [Pseudomonadota bacterium]MBU2480385.1 ATP-binding protein [Pseudomonadota bacterium]